MGILRNIRRAGNKSTEQVRRYFAFRLIWPWERPSIMRKHIYTGAMGNVYFFLISGIFFIYFGNRIGLTPFHWGVMSSISSLLLSAQLLAAFVTRRSGQRKLLWFVAAFLNRSARFGGILIAFWLWRKGSASAVPVLIGCICLSNFLMALSIPPWMSWLTDIIPEEEHGTFWGRRMAWIRISSIVVMVLAGLLMDRAPEEQKPLMALGIFACAAIFGILDLVIHGTIPEPMMTPRDRKHFVQELIEPLRDRAFRPWLTFNAAWTFAMTLGGALAMIYFVEDLGIRKNFLVGSIVLTGCTMLGGLFASRRAGVLVDRHGPKKMMMLGHAFWALLPGFWIFATPATAAVWLAAGSFNGGAASTAALTAQNKFITRFSGEEDCAMYVAVSSCIGSLAAAAGVFIAGTVLDALKDWSWQAAGWTFGRFQLLFIVSVCLRMSSVLFLLPRVRMGGEGGRA